MFRRFAFLSVFSACVLVPSLAAAQSQPVTIAWNANVEPGIVGYTVWVGTTPSVYSQVFDTGNVTQFTFRDGIAGQRYYFAVSAYAEGPIASERSTEVSAIVLGSVGSGGGWLGGSGGGGSSGGGSTGGGGGGGSASGGSGGGGGGSSVGPTPGMPSGEPSGPVGPAVVMQPAFMNGYTVTLVWSAVGGLVASEYLLEAGTAPGLSNLYNASVGAATSISAQIGDGTYYVRVRGRGPDGTVTVPSNEVIFVAGQAACSTPPTPPTGLVGSANAGQAMVRWLPGTGATSYLVQAGSAPGLSDIFHGNVGSVAAVSAQVQPGFTAYVRVVSVNGCGQSAPSTEIFMQ